MKAYLIGLLMGATLMSSVAYADDAATSQSNTSPNGEITFTIPNGFKYFRVDCGSHAIKHTRKYTISSDRKLLTFVEDDDGWMQFINESCMITLYKG